MSNNKDIFRKVFGIWKNFYLGEPKGNFARKLNTLAAMINGTLVSYQTQLSPSCAENTW